MPADSEHKASRPQPGSFFPEGVLGQNHHQPVVRRPPPDCQIWHDLYAR